MLRGLAAAGAGRHRDALHREAQAPHGDAARRRRRSTRAIDIGAIVDSGAARAHRSRWSSTGAAKAARSVSRRDRVARRTAASFRRRSSRTSRPPSTLAQEEIFGPVLVTMSFRTPDEAVALANNTRYGLAASVWSETIGRALDIAPRLAVRRRLDQRDQSVRRGGRLRRLSRIGLSAAKADAKACTSI